MTTKRDMSFEKIIEMFRRDDNITAQILLTYQNRAELKGKLAFDLPSYQKLIFSDLSELRLTFPPLMATLLQKFNLIS